MAPRKPPPQRLPAVLSIQQKRIAIARLKERVAELEALDLSTINEGNDPAVRMLESAIENTISGVFGPESHEYGRLRRAWDLDDTTYSINLSGYGYGHSGPSVQEIRAGVDRGRKRALALLQQAIKTLGEELRYAEPAEGAVPGHHIGEDAKPATDEVFVVHGHDNEARLDVTRVLERAGLIPIVLHEQPNKGMTVIEKLEHHSNVGFAVVIMTPDDVGGPAGGASQPRARQNVVAELFYFMGKLTRARVCALKKGELEIPSDIGGVVYVSMDAGGGWKQDLLRELDEAGYSVNWREALK